MTINESKSHSRDEDIQKTIFITGATSGIGYYAAVKLISLGHNLIIPCRNLDRANNLLSLLEKESILQYNFRGSISLPIMDLSDLNSINKCVSQIISNNLKLDILILNAGLQYTGSKTPKWSKQDIELTFAVNHLAHQYLTELLLPLLKRSKQPRIVITSSEVHNPRTSGGRIGMPACGALAADKLILNKTNARPKCRMNMRHNKY